MTRRRCPRHVSQGENRKSSSPQCCWLGQHVFCPLLSRPCSRASETPLRLILVLFFTENGVKSLAPILASPPCAHAYAWLLTGSATPLQQGQNAATVTMNELQFLSGEVPKTGATTLHQLLQHIHNTFPYENTQRLPLLPADQLKETLHSSLQEDKSTSQWLNQPFKNWKIVLSKTPFA